MAIERRAHATWEGDLRGGAGHFDLTSSNAITGQEVTFASRFEQPGGKTSPEELIAAAHATCFSMALAGVLAQGGHPPTKLETDAGYRITTMQLTVQGEVEGIGEDEFESAAKQAEKGCPVSNALTGVEISFEASLA